MHTRIRWLLPLVAFVPAACSDQDSQRRVDAMEARDRQAAHAAEANEQAAIDDIEANVRVRMLQTRVDALEQEVGALKNTRQALDLDLLNQRVAALEAKQAAAPADARPAPAPRPSPVPRPSATPRPAPRPTPTGTPTPRPARTSS